MHKIVNVIYKITGGAVFGLLIVIALVIGLLGLIEAAFKRLGLTILIFAVWASPAFAQGVVTGSETTIFYSGTNVTIVPPNTPATSFASPNGTNTFLIPIPSPSVSIRFYVTNNSAIACSNAFTAQLWAVSDAATNSFNSSLSNWQVIPLQDSTGNLVQALLPSIPASGVSYFSSTAISAPRVAFQFVNVTGGCASTNLEVTAVISPVALTVPLISANSPSGFNGSAANQVQGIVAQQQNGAFVNPVLSGGVQLPINVSLLTVGIDNFNSSSKSVQSGFSGLITVNTSPAPAGANELAVSIEGAAPDNIVSNIVSPWVCTTGGCNNAGGVVTSSSMKNPKSGTPFQRTFTQASVNSGQDLDVIVLFSSPTATVRQAVQGNTTATATLANGSAILTAVSCNITNCQINTPTDTQGNVYTLLSSQRFSNALQTSALWVWASTTLSVVGSNTITFVSTVGTITSSQQIEVSGITPASLTTPSITSQLDSTGAQIIRSDAQFPNQFVCNVTLSTNTTTQCQPAPTVIYSIPVRLYVTDIQIQTTTAGTTSAISLKAGTGSNCATGTVNLSAISYADTVVGLTQVMGARTPLIAPLQSAVCVTQAGAVAGTSTVELRGFLAP